MSRGNDCDRGRAMQMRPANNILDEQLVKWNTNDSLLPCTFVIDQKFEHTMPVRCTERNGVFPRNTRYRWERSTDVGVKHGKFELKIFQARKRFPRACLRVEF